MAAYKEDEDIKALVDQEGDSNFLFFAQTKHQRMQYLKMQRQSSMMNQMQKMPTNPYVQMMMMRSRMGMGGQGFGGFGGRMGMNSMMGGNRGMGMGMNSMSMNSMGMNSMGMNSMGMNSMGMNNMGMNPMSGMMQGSNSGMNQMGGMMQGGPMMQMMGGQMPGMPKMGPQGMQGDMMNNQMHQNPGQSMNMLNSQMKNMNLIPAQHTQATGDLPFEIPPPPEFPVIQTEETLDINTPPTSQEEWEKIGKMESLSSQKNYIEKFSKEFQTLTIEFQSQMLGDLIYSALSEYELDEETQGQITGMLNDYDVLSLNEILELLSNPDIMKERINEALELINGEKNEEDDEDNENDEKDN